MKREKLSRRDFLRMSALTAAGAALASCAPKVVTQTEEVEVTREVEKVVTATPAPVETKEVEMFWHMTEWEDWATEIVTPMFEEKNPGYTMTWTFVNDPENETVLTNRMAAGDPPALFVVLGGPAIPWLQEDKLVDLSQFPELEGNLSHFPESGWVFCRVARDAAGYPKEGIWGVPTMNAMTGVFYDKNKFEMLGLEPVETYDELWGLVAALEESGEFTHAVAWGNHRWMTYNNFWQVSNALIGHDVGEGILRGDYKLDSDEMVNKVWGYWERIGTQGYADEDWKSIEWGTTESSFANWKYGIILQGPWLFSSYPQINPDIELGVFPFPTEDGSNRAWVSFLEARNWWMPKDYPDREAQVRAMELVSSAQYADSQLKDANIVPMYQKEWEYDAPVVTEMLNKGFPLTSQWNNTVNLGIPTGEKLFWEYSFENLPKLTSGEMTAAQFGAMIEDWYKDFRI